MRGDCFDDMDGIDDNHCVHFLSIILTLTMVSMLAHIKRERAGIPLTRITSPHTHTCHKQGFGFPTSHVVAVIVFNELRREVIGFFG